jgi:hypothetical protein
METEQNDLEESVEGDDETSGVDAPSEEGESLPDPPEESEGAVPDEATAPDEGAE